jgi:hypothetical protein
VTRRTARELTALADGALPQKRREPLLRRVSASPKLAEALKLQLVAIQAIHRLKTPAPPELHKRIQRAIRDAGATPQRSPPTEQ